MHILFLTDNFPPEVNALASRTYEHCREWVKLGHKVTVVTCAPNFPKGKLFDGYKNKLFQKENMGGINVLRMWTYMAPNEGFLKRIIDYNSFMIMGAIGGLFVRKVDVVVGSSPQFFTIGGAWLVGKLKRIPWVFELRDLWPESIVAVGAMKKGKILGFFEKLSMFFYKSADHIISVTHAFKKDLMRKGIDGKKISVVLNGVDLEKFKPRPKNNLLSKKLNLEQKFVVGYIGTHGMAHALETLLLSAKKLIENRKVHFLFLGDGANKVKLKNQAKSLGLDNVTFLDTVPKNEVAQYWSLLDVAIIHLKNDPLFETVIPSKLFECMGMGLPVLHGVRGESSDIVLSHNIGICFDPENVDSLSQMIVDLENNKETRAQYRKNALQAAPNYERKKMAKKMLSTLEKIVKIKDA